MLLEQMLFPVLPITSLMEPTAVCAQMRTSSRLTVAQQLFTQPVLPPRSLAQEFVQTAAQSMQTGLHAQMPLMQLLVQLVHT
jgi:hypothetical protein